MIYSFRITFRSACTAIKKMGWSKAESADPHLAIVGCHTESLFPTLSAHRFTESIAGARSASCHMEFHLPIHADSGNSLVGV
jgi:hypothetical protein